MAPPRHPDPLTADEFLKEMTCAPGLFTLGSFNRYITVHSQQIRAVNLVHALSETAGALADKKIAIVGAGFAGVTAAAYALERTNAQVTVFEAAARALWLQDHCRGRWLHPGLYDWPLPGSLEPRTYLPVMNWKTGTAQDVVAQVREQWEDVQSRKANLTCCFDSKVSAVAQQGDGRWRLTVNTEPEDNAFDFVIFTIGFGVEDAGLAQPSYWNDVDGLLGATGKVLISGFGDGGLADLLRLCLPGYRQDRLIELVRGIDDETAARVVDAERALAGNAANLNAFYEELESVRVVNLLKAERADGPRISITGRGHLYGTGSAILNRFLVSQLHRARPEAFSVLREEVKHVTPSNDGFRVTFQGDRAEEFRCAILRHGPRSAVAGIEGLLDPRIADERRQHWRSLPQALDRTRVPLFNRPEPVIELGSQLSALPSYESSGDPWCLVIAREESKLWPKTAQTVLNKLSDPRPNEGAPVQIATKPLFVTAEEAISGEAQYRAVIRALCSADVFIADVGGFDDPAVMMFLGIRAAVRRGVTVICTGESLTNELWQKVPFNIREIRPISLKESNKRISDLADAIRDGLGQSRLGSAYLDLPVYEYVRQPLSDEAPGPTPVLFLRSFSDGYKDGLLDGVTQSVESALRNGHPNHGPGFRLYSIIEESSPRLASQRLYAAIRHRELCLIDWSEWRANVFFEMGVRLASHPKIPLCILDKAPDPHAPASKIRQKLQALLSPFVYEDSTEVAGFKSAVRRYLAEKERRPNPAFEAAAQFFDSSRERYRTKVDEHLSTVASANVVTGDPLQSVEVDVLYADRDPNFARQVLGSSFEQLCAAWCYLDEREAPHVWKPSALLDPSKLLTFLRYRKLGLRLRLALATRRAERDRRLLDRIGSRQSVTRDLSALADGLNQWSSVRNVVDRLRLGRDEVEAPEIEESIQDLQDLEQRILALGSPAAMVVRQGLAHDLHFLKQALEAQAKP